MRFAHMSDLHFGKKLYEASLYDDQLYVIDKLRALCAGAGVDAVVVAGDIYDKHAPTAEAVTLFDAFLNAMATLKVPILIISGNHDSPERLAFGHCLLERANIYIEAEFSGAPRVITLRDGNGEVDFHLLPFLRPGTARRFFPDEQIGCHEDAVRLALAARPPDASRRNVLVAHQYAVKFGQDVVRSDSERIALGGIDRMDASLFDAYDYAALGHIHNPQSAGASVCRYCGTPLKYSFSEAQRDKSLTIVELADKGEVSLEFLPIAPLHDLRCIKGTLDALLSADARGGVSPDDYIRATLTDDAPLDDPMRRLREAYPNTLTLELERHACAPGAMGAESAESRGKTSLERFSSFYELQTGAALSDEGMSIVRRSLEKAGECV